MRKLIGTVVMVSSIALLGACTNDMVGNPTMDSGMGYNQPARMETHKEMMEGKHHRHHCHHHHHNKHHKKHHGHHHHKHHKAAKAEKTAEKQQ